MKTKLVFSALILSGILVVSSVQATFISSYAVGQDAYGGILQPYVDDSKQQKAEVTSNSASSASTALASGSAAIDLDTGVLRASAYTQATEDFIEGAPGYRNLGFWFQGNFSTADRLENTHSSNAGSIIDFTDGLTVHIARNGTDFQILDLQGGMFATGHTRVDAVFSNTATMSLALPEGMAYTLTSGVFLAHPAYNEPGNSDTLVPEPATMLIIGSGLAGLTAAGRRRK